MPLTANNSFIIVARTYIRTGLSTTFTKSIPIKLRNLH